VPPAAEPDVSLFIELEPVPLVDEVPLSDELLERLEGELPFDCELVLWVALVEDVLLLFLSLCMSPMARA
jgi:hypothetical protein